MPASISGSPSPLRVRNSKLGRGDPAISVDVGIGVHRKHSQVAVFTEGQKGAAEQEPSSPLDDLLPLAGLKLVRPRRCAAADAPA
jgi:hypothetical protein